MKGVLFLLLNSLFALLCTLYFVVLPFAAAQFNMLGLQPYPCVTSTPAELELFLPPHILRIIQDSFIDCPNKAGKLSIP